MTQTQKTFFPFIGDEFRFFSHVGLKVSLCTHATWRCMRHWIKARESALLDLVDFSLPYRDQTHVINSEPLITLVKSNGSDLILHSANNRATRGYLSTLR